MFSLLPHVLLLLTIHTLLTVTATFGSLLNSMTGAGRLSAHDSSVQKRYNVARLNPRVMPQCAAYARKVCLRQIGHLRTSR